MVFKDQLVRCAACGTEFVYTVREQRARAQDGLSLDSPPFCRDCRGADVRLAEAADASRGTSAGGSGGAEVPHRSAGRARTGNRKPRGDRGGSGKGRSGRQRHGDASRRRSQRQTELRFRYSGVVKWFDNDKAFGFISADEDGDELFVHASAILAEGVRTLFEGQPVEYEVEQTARGLQAVDVIPLEY